MANELIKNGAIYLHGTIVPDRVVEYYDQGVFSASMVRDALSKMDGETVVWVNSPGGDPHAGEAIRVMLADHEGGVTVKVAGDASSAASLMIMGAERIEISAGSVIMIHDPSTITLGNAEDHEKTVEMLNVLADTYASVYAERSGKTKDEVRALMKAETWLGPDAAISEGFADAVIDAVDPDLQMNSGLAAGQLEAAKANHQSALNMLSDALSKSTTAPPAGTQATAIGGPQLAVKAEKEVNMTKKTGAAPTSGKKPDNQPAVTADPQPPADGGVQMTADQILAAERKRSRDITNAAKVHVMSGALDQDFVDGLIDEGVSVEMASHRILTKLADAQPDIGMHRRGGPVQIGRDEVSTRREGLALAMGARLTGEDPASDVARPYMGLSIVEMAAVSMGQDLPRFGSYASREQLMMDAMHSTSDFPNILSTSVNRVLESQYELVGRTFTELSREMTFNDFRPHDVVRPDEFPTLKKVSETGEIKFGSLGDGKETVALAAYATGISISRHALVNDDLGAIQDVIDNAAAIVPEFEEDVFWTYFLSNVALGDGTAMFHADHGNLAASGGAISVTTVAAGRKALRQMKAADGKRTIKMNAPSILLVGPEKETEAEKFLKETAPTKADDVNPFAGKLRSVVTEAIEDKQWYLLVDPAKRTHNVKHGYLRDRSAPRVRVDEPFGTQGMRMTLEHDFGVGGVNHRGGYKNAGA